MLAIKTPDHLKIPLVTPKPAREPSGLGRRNYDEAKAALLASVAEPRRLTGNATRDVQAWDARLREYETAQRRFDAVYRDLAPEYTDLIFDHRETLRDASRLLDTTVDPPAVIERRMDDGINRNIAVYDRDEKERIGTIEPVGAQFRAVAADGVDLGMFGDWRSASAAIRADANQ